MPLTTIMGSDANCNGQVLAYAFLMNETAETISELIQIFMDVNKDCNGLKTVVLDKSFAEISSVKALLPEVDVILCQFHVVQIWQRQLTGGKNIILLFVCICYCS